MPHNDLSPEQEALLQRFAARQHETEDAESRLVERYGNRAALARQVWTVICAMLCGAVIATAYILGIKGDVERNERDIVQLRADTSRNYEHNRADINRLADRVEILRLEMVNKVDRKKDP